MGTFNSSLDVRVIDDCSTRPLLMTISEFTFDSDFLGPVVVPAGFKFDGASIPQAAMGITGWPGLRAACVHDWLLFAESYTRREADKAFHEALLSCGVSTEMADLMYAAVRAYSVAVTPPAYPTDNVGA